MIVAATPRRWRRWGYERFIESEWSDLDSSVATVSTPGAVAVAWDEPRPLGGPDSTERVDVECRVALADAIRLRRAAMSETATGRQFLPAMTDAELLSDFVAVHWARFVGADGRLVAEGGESVDITISTAAE